jgi:aminoglycoside phosphotransferase (APT) family kinase protein
MPPELPPEVDVTPPTVAAIVARFNLNTRTATRLSHQGTSHTVFFLDERYVLRVPRNHPLWPKAASHEALAVPAARAAGVRTPALVAVDATCELLPVPYTIFERIHGVPLNALCLAPEANPEVWYELGRDLARLHRGVVSGGPLDQLPADEADRDPRPWVAGLAADGTLSSQVATYVQATLERLAPLALPRPPRAFCHGDVNVGNVLVDPETHSYRALIDWAGAMWGDCAFDLAVVALQAVPLLLQGYRSIIAFDADPTLEERVLWHHMRVALYGLWRAPGQDGERARRRMERLFGGISAFLASRQGERLADLRPPESF